MQLILCKDNARREQNEINVFISYAEPKLILCKDNARREQNEINVFISYAEPKLILCKDNANRMQNEINTFISYAEIRRNKRREHKKTRYRMDNESCFWWALTDSNRRPSACKADALNQLS